MKLDLTAYSAAERATFTLRALDEQAGWRKYRCSRFEEYALYQQYQRFLSDAQVVTFTDLDGKLDVTKIADPADFADWSETDCKG